MIKETDEIFIVVFPRLLVFDTAIKQVCNALRKQIPSVDDREIAIATGRRRRETASNIRLLTLDHHVPDSGCLLQRLTRLI